MWVQDECAQQDVLFISVNTDPMILASPQCHHAKSGHWLSYEVGRGIESAVGCARAVRMSETHAPSQTANRVLSWT